MLHFDDIVFGPVHSRRLGTSLGLNILPSKGKTCNFDCVYCECGWNRDGAVPGRRFPAVDEVEKSMQTAFSALASEGTSVDSITMSGNGEPTLNPDFPQIVDSVFKLRDKFSPNAKVSVLSNATMTYRPDVVEALKKVDNPILKLDAATDELVKLIDRPSGSYSVAGIIENLKAFEGNFILQTMFLDSPDFVTWSEEALGRWYHLIRELKPREIMVYTIDRETPDKRLKKCSVDQMTKFVAPLVEEGFKVQVRG